MLLTVPDKVELERRVGFTYKFDFSFASLWSVECLLNTIRQVPQWQVHTNWLLDYITTLLERAYQEMGLSVDATQVGVLKTRSPDYTQSLVEDFPKLLNLQDPFPTFYGLTWKCRPVLEMAAVPWYGLACVFQNQAWAKAEPVSLSQAPERRDRAVKWLTQEYLRSEFDNQEVYVDCAREILRPFFWPPLISENIPDARENITKILEVCQKWPNEEIVVNVLSKLLISQDRLVSILAAAVCFLINMGPSTRFEALCMLRCLDYFAKLPEARFGKPDERILSVIQILSDTPAGTVDIDQNPKKYDEFSELLNTGAEYVTQQRWAEADLALFAAQKLHPYSNDVRHWLLSSYFARKKPAT
jgi:hypothetical protein